MKNTFFLFLLFILCCFLADAQPAYIQVLGIAQDGGYPHIGCEKHCCNAAWKKPALRKTVVSLALVNPATKQWWLFEATPDIKQQLHDFRQSTNGAYPYLPSGIFLSHAHIGHYAGLMELGKEALNSKNIPVYVLPRMKSFLEQNGPWSQLVKLNNIQLVEIQADTSINIADNKITAFTVPHRDEFSETAGFIITTPQKKYLFIPDINKWSQWQQAIIEEVKKVDIAFLDATFYTVGELNNRNIAEVPHPLVTETMNLFSKEPASEKDKIYFIHFNHTNPLLWDKQTRQELLNAGFHLAGQMEQY